MYILIIITYVYLFTRDDEPTMHATFACILIYTKFEDSSSSSI